MKDKVCPVCGEGRLHSKTEKVEFEYKSIKKTLITKYSVCDECESEIASEDDAKFNKRAVTAFHKTVDGLLTGDELRKTRKDLGITQQQASIIFGGGPNSFTKYESDDVIQSVAMDNLIRLALASIDALDILCRKSGVERREKRTTTGLSASAEADLNLTPTSAGWFSASPPQEKNHYFAKVEYH